MAANPTDRHFCRCFHQITAVPNSNSGACKKDAVSRHAGRSETTAGRLDRPQDDPRQRNSTPSARQTQIFRYREMSAQDEDIDQEQNRVKEHRVEDRIVSLSQAGICNA